MDAKEQSKKILWALYEAARIGEPMSIERTIIENGLNEFHQAKSKEEAVDITNKVETLIGYLELWYRRYSPPSGFFAVIEEAKEWLAAFGKEGEEDEFGPVDLTDVEPDKINPSKQIER